MSNKRINKAYVRYDGTGRVIAGSLILSRLKPKVGNWHEIPAYECCNPTTTVPLPLRLLFVNIEDVTLEVGDVNNVADWNTYFDLPALGIPFTSVEVVGNEVKLYGGSNIKIKPAIMYDLDDYIIEVDDQAGCVTSVGGDAFSYSTSLTLVNLPECTILYGYQDSPENDYGAICSCANLVNVNIPKVVTIGDYGFASNPLVTSLNFPLLTSLGNHGFSNCNSVTLISFPNLVSVGTHAFANFLLATSASLPLATSIGDVAFGDCTALTSISIPSCTSLGSTVGFDNVFLNILGNTITLTVPSALMTCDAGNPDGDIVYLQSGNTVTVITV